MWAYGPKPGSRSMTSSVGNPLCMSLNVTDKQAARQIQRDKVAEFERERVGILAPKEMRQAAQRDLAKLIADFARDLRVRGRASKYADNLQMRIGKLAKECNWKQLQDVTPDSFVAWRSRQAMAPKTINEYLNAVSGLLNWLQRNGRVPANPLKIVGKVETRGRETRQR